MDHLPLPIDELAHPPVEVPFVCNDQFCYDDKGFLTYPSRLGVDVHELCISDNVDWDQWAPFLQAWLWFGLLHEAFDLECRSDAFKRSEILKTLVETKPDGTRIVTTRKLHRCIHAALDADHTHQYGPFDARLSALNDSIKEIVSTSSWQKMLVKSRTFTTLPTVYRVLLSAQILGETMYTLRNDHFRNHTIGPTSEIHFEIQLGFDLVDILLEEAGWCPFHIPKLPTSLRVRYYLSYILPFDAKDHNRCSRNVCNALAPEESLQRFRPIHTSIDCACSNISVSDADIEAVIRRGEIPLLTFPEDPEDQRRLKIISTNVKTEDNQLPPRDFVAISHVRHMGLGNHGEQSLPYCQLASIQLLANDLAGTTIRSVPFWIDTICLPLQRQSKASALRDVHRVYQAASKVIVLDPSLYRRSVASYEDCIFRIRYSSWKTRLWTLQEGFLAKELYISFRNLSYRLDDIIEGYEKRTVTLLSLIDRAECVDTVWLKSALDQFNTDIKTSIDQGKKIDLLKLRKMLRLGYLAFQQYRYFCEAHEAVDSGLVLRTLKSVYDNELLDSKAQFISKGYAIERLRYIEATQLSRHD